MTNRTCKDCGTPLAPDTRPFRHIGRGRYVHETCIRDGGVTRSAPHSAHTLTGGKTESNLEHLQNEHGWNSSMMDEPFTLPFHMIRDQHDWEHKQKGNRR